AKAKKAEQNPPAPVQQPVKAVEPEEIDPRKAAVAAAIARVRAKKAAQEKQEIPTE
ncbi:hypothetical protein ID854_09785, partial [Xenorhabdus sp. M]|nr:hypothetical protein [Xenorhabdus sp. M]